MTLAAALAGTRQSRGRIAVLAGTDFAAWHLCCLQGWEVAGQDTCEGPLVYLPSVPPFCQETGKLHTDGQLCINSFPWLMLLNLCSLL